MGSGTEFNNQQDPETQIELTNNSTEFKTEEIVSSARLVRELIQNAGTISQAIISLFEKFIASPNDPEQPIHESTLKINEMTLLAFLVSAFLGKTVYFKLYNEVHLYTMESKVFIDGTTTGIVDTYSNAPGYMIMSILNASKTLRDAQGEQLINLK